MSVPDHRVEFFDAGHAAFLEDPERFAAVFRKFAGVPAGREVFAELDAT